MAFRFQSRLVISGYMNCRDGARIKATNDSRLNAAELYALKDVSGLPYIPGSNFKGLIRKHVESYLREIIGANAACNPYSKDTSCIRLGEPTQDDSVYLRRLIDSAEGNEEELRFAIERNSCLACSLFGSQILESQVTLEDLRPVSWGGQFNLRKNQAQQEDFSPENKENRFMFRAILDNCEPWKRALFLVGLGHLQSRLTTVAAGKSNERLVATLEDVEMRSLESALELLLCLDNFKATDGNPVALEQQQSWMNDLRLKLNRQQTKIAC